MIASISGARLITPQEARVFIEPLLQPFLAPEDLAFALDRELSLDDEYDRRSVLTLPDGADVPGDLMLDSSESVYDASGWRGVLALGRLTVRGDILAEDPDGAPFLVTAGDLHVRQIIKGGAALVVRGQLEASGRIYCFYNHGSFRALGGVTARGLIIDDQPYQIEGAVEAPAFILGVDDPGEKLVEDLLWETDDGFEPVDEMEEEIIARLKDGRPVLRGEVA